MKTILQIVIGIGAIVLAYFLYSSLMKPIRFNDAVQARNELVIQRLKDIRELEVAYKDVYSHFAGSFDTLINFYKYDSLKILRQVGSWDDSVAVAKKQVYTDTIRIAVKDSLFKSVKGFSIDSLRKVPIVGDEFDLDAIIFASVSGVNIPLFEASVSNDVYLRGLDRQSIVNLSDNQLNKYGKFPGLKVGSIDQPNNNAGNWE
jgi:hypothetical protein